MKPEINALENIIERIPYYIFWKNKESVYLGCNQRFATLAGKKYPQDIVGKTDYDLNWSQAEPALFQQGDYDVMHGMPKVNVEEALIRPDGSQIVMLVSKVPLRDKHNNCIGILGISTDITERKQMEENLKTAKENAELSSRAKTEFIANMSHDIRTPLTGIIGMATVLEQESKNEKERDNARMLCQSGNKLLELLNSVLDVVSAGEASEENVKYEKFDLCASIQGLYDLLLPSATMKGLKLKIDIDPKVPKLIINDRIKIERILLNLITNSIKFTEKGHVEVQINVISQQDDQAHLEFKIHDTGIGIAKGELHKVFDRFFRATPTYEGVYPGHGVGLYIVKKFVTLLGGEVHLSSELGKGSTFRFALLMKCEQMNEPEPAIEEPVKSFSNAPQFSQQVTTTDSPSALLVEDDPIASRVAKSFLQIAGFDVKTAENGELAFKLAKKGKFALIVSDVGLPGMSGNEWTAAYRHWEWISGSLPVPIIGLTAHATGKTKEDCLAAGMNDVLRKPINLRMAEDLFQQISVKVKDKIQRPEEESTISGLGFELPNTEDELFQLNNYLLFDEKDALEKLGGNPTSLTEIIMQLTEEDLIKEVSVLKEAHKQSNWDAIEETAHKLKGGALYCGTFKMRYACQYMERYRKAGHTAAQEKLFKQLIDVLEETRNYLSGWLIRSKKL